MGMPRRSVTYSDPSFQPLAIVAFLGSLVILSALVMLLVQIGVSIRDRKETRRAAG